MEKQNPNPAASLESDLAEIRLLFRQAVEIGNNMERNVDTRLAMMAAASRLFAATTQGCAVLARLRGEGVETRHRLIVERAEDAPRPVQSRRGPLSAEELAEQARRVNATAERYYAAKAAEKPKGIDTPRAKNENNRVARSQDPKLNRGGAPLGQSQRAQDRAAHRRNARISRPRSAGAADVQIVATPGPPGASAPRRGCADRRRRAPGRPRCNRRPANW